MELRCVMYPQMNAVLHPDFRARIGHEIYFFSSREAMRTFLADPIRYAGPLTDPISRVRFTPDEASPRYEHNGRPYFFASQQTLEVFLADPERYADLTREIQSM